jgi:hypothetical protein
MSNDEKETDEYGVKFLVRFRIFADKSEVSECYADERDNSEEIKSNGDYITDPSPCTTGSDRYDRGEEEVEKYSEKVDSSGDTSESTECSYSSVAFSCEEDREFGDSDGFSEDDWDSHKENQVPRLVAREEFHIVCHFHRLKS